MDKHIGSFAVLVAGIVMLISAFFNLASRDFNLSTGIIWVVAAVFTFIIENKNNKTK